MISDVVVEENEVDDKGRVVQSTRVSSGSHKSNK